MMPSARRRVDAVAKPLARLSNLSLDTRASLPVLPRRSVASRAPRRHIREARAASYLRDRTRTINLCQDSVPAITDRVRA
jgi:hypothetical protein